MRVLVTGGSGMLGATLVKELTKDYEVFSTGSSEFDQSPKYYKTFNLNTENVDDLIQWSNPDVIILCGAITNGNYCDQNPNEAFQVNGISVRNFINSTLEKVKFIYISSDAVFPSKLKLAKETDVPYPDNVYGKSKEFGEFFLLNSNREFTIIRTTIVGLNINSNKSGFVEWIINSSVNKESISLFDDVVFNPITIWDLSKEISFLIKQPKLTDRILHISSREVVTKYKFGKELLKRINLSFDNVNRGRITEFVNRAKRCNDQSLDCNFYQEKYNRSLPNLEETVKSIKAHYYESN
jgi:dTDP-4-dehydrorhamnose reductase